MPARSTRPRPKTAGRRGPPPHLLALGLAIGVLVAFFAAATVVGALLLRAGDAVFSPTLTRAVPYGLTIVLALLGVVIAPLAIDRGITGAFRKLQPEARGTPAQTFVVWNLLLFTACVLLAPRATRNALEHHGNWLVRGVLPDSISGAFLKMTRWAASNLPGDPPPAATAPPPKPPAPSAQAPASSPAPARSQAPTAEPVASVAPAPPAPEASAPKPVASSEPDVDHDLSTDEVFAARHAAVVTIFALYRGADAQKDALRPLVATAPGVVVGADGLVVTFEPLVRDASSLVVGLDGARWSSPVEVLVADKARGLALVKVPLEGLSAAPLADAQKLGVGERVVAIVASPGLKASAGEAVVGALREGPGGSLVQVRPLAADPVDGPLFDLRGRLVGLGPAKAEGRAVGPSALSVKHVHELLAQPRAPRRLEPWPEASGVEGLRLEGDELSARERAQIGDALKLWTASIDACTARAGEASHLTLTLAPPAPGADVAAALAKAPPQITSGLGAEGDRCVEKRLQAFHAAVVRALLHERNEAGGPTVPLTLSYQTNLSPREGETKPRTLSVHYVIKARKPDPAEGAP
jgi:S1-C subfamily serine protease